MNKTGIFLDRDGTINEEVDFLTSPQHLHLIPKSADAIREANKLGLKVIVITNQSGIARGLLTEDQLFEIHKELALKLKQRDAYIDKFYFCPHHPEFGRGIYKKDCECRKPKIGMLKQSVEEFGIDLSRSFVIGDKEIDIQTGNNAGTKTILVKTGYGIQELELCRKDGLAIDYVAENLYNAIEYIKSKIS